MSNEYKAALQRFVDTFQKHRAYSHAGLAALQAEIGYQVESAKALLARPEPVLPFHPSLITALRTRGCDSCDQICFAAADAIEALSGFEPVAVSKERLLATLDRLINEEDEESVEPAAAEKARELFTLDEWTEKDGDVLWWKFPIVEAPYVGSPLDDDWHDMGYGAKFTHWTRIPLPSPPAATGEASTPIPDEPDPEETSDDPPRAMDFIPPHLAGGCA